MYNGICIRVYICNYIYVYIHFGNQYQIESEVANTVQMLRFHAMSFFFVLSCLITQKFEKYTNRYRCVYYI